MPKRTFQVGAEVTIRLRVNREVSISMADNESEPSEDELLVYVEDWFDEKIRDGQYDLDDIEIDHLREVKK